MSWNGSGVFTRLYNWVTDAAGAIPITPSRMDNDTNDIVAGLNNCLTRDGQGKPSANLTMNGFKLTGLAAATTAGDALSYGGPGSFSQVTVTNNATGITQNGNIAASMGIAVINANSAGSADLKLSSNGTSKSIRCSQLGFFEIVNNAYSAVIASLSDVGDGQFMASVRAPVVQATTRYLVPNGSATVPSIAFASDGATDTGFFWNLDGYINWTCNGVQGGSFLPGGGISIGGAFSGSGAGLTGTAASLTAGAASTDNQHFGVGQTWQNVIGSRTNGNPYTNPSSTKAMSVYVRGNHSSLGIPTIQATIGGVEVGYLQLGQGGAGVSGDLCLSFIVPPSATYTVTSSTGVAVWSELF